MGLLQPDVGHGGCDGETHLIPPGRAITVISPAQVAAALSAAATTGQPVILLSAPYAAGNVGPAWFAALIADSMAVYPEIAATPVLDCGDAPGFALAALRLGLRSIRYGGPAAARIRDIAGQYGAIVLAERPDSLDLQSIDAAGGDMTASCIDWLTTNS
jgi:hypothetical protein